MGKVLFVVGLLVFVVVASVAFWAFVYNRWFWYQPPAPKKLEACVDGGLEYRWYVPTHGYECSDNWTFPGFHGV
jgi:hypothetical protein